MNAATLIREAPRRAGPNAICWGWKSCAAMKLN